MIIYADWRLLRKGMELGCCNYGKVVGLLEPVLDLKLEFVHTRLTAMCHICFNIWEMQGWHHARFWKSQSSISLHSFPRHSIYRKKDHQRCFSFLKKKEQKHGWWQWWKDKKNWVCTTMLDPRGWFTPKRISSDIRKSDPNITRLIISYPK